MSASYPSYRVHQHVSLRVHLDLKLPQALCGGAAFDSTIGMISRSVARAAKAIGRLLHGAAQMRAYQAQYCEAAL